MCMLMHTCNGAPVSIPSVALQLCAQKPTQGQEVRVKAEMLTDLLLENSQIGKGSFSFVRSQGHTVWAGNSCQL